MTDTFVITKRLEVVTKK